MICAHTISKQFEDQYGITPSHIIFSPYRLCPLGAHVDHQLGRVTGMALDLGVFFAFAPRNDSTVCVKSGDFSPPQKFDLKNIPRYRPDCWGNYIRGAAQALQQNHFPSYGLNGWICGSFPSGGLSSSAAVMGAYLMALAHVNEICVSKRDLIEMGRYIENKYIGLNNGILDEASNVLSKKDRLLYLDTKTEEYELIQPGQRLQPFEILLVYSGISTNLMSTDYNQRVHECRQAATALLSAANRSFDPNKVTLRDVDDGIYREYKSCLSAKLAKRAKHFFEENQRVVQGVKAWQQGDLQSFGRLIFDSGESSITNYECGSEPLIAIYRLLQGIEGVYGARFSGAGYRGSAFAWVDPSQKERIAHSVDRAYRKSYPSCNSFRMAVCAFDDGLRML